MEQKKKKKQPIEIVIPWFGPRAILILFLMFGILGITIFLFSLKVDGALVAILVFANIAMMYGAVGMCFNRTVIRMDSKEVSFRSGPFPGMGGNAPTFALKKLRCLKIHSYVIVKKGIPVPCHDLVGELVDHTDIVLLEKLARKDLVEDALPLLNKKIRKKHKKIQKKKAEKKAKKKAAAKN